LSRAGGREKRGREEEEVRSIAIYHPEDGTICDRDWTRNTGNRRIASGLWNRDQNKKGREHNWDDLE